MKLSSTRVALDAALDGGLPVAALTECGMPRAQEGRYVLVPYLAQATQGWMGKPWWVLWIKRPDELQIFPPAWFARGVVPEYWAVAESASPMQDLQRVFLRPFFKVIVLDAPQKLSAEDCAFISHQARLLQLTVIIVRPYFLSHNRGNVWAKLRFNAWRTPRQGAWNIRVIRGGREGQHVLSSEVLQ